MIIGSGKYNWNKIDENFLSGIPPLDKELLCFTGDYKFEIGCFYCSDDGINYKALHDWHINRFPKYWTEIDIPEDAKKQKFLEECKNLENIIYEKEKKINEENIKLDKLKDELKNLYKEGEL